MVARRSDLWILVGLVSFALVFILGATWMGSRKRMRYRLEPLPAVGVAESELIRRLSILTPRFPEAVQWLRAGGDQRQARVEPDPSIAVAERAVLLLLQGRPAEAVAVARSAFERDESDVTLGLALGLALEAADDKESAMDAYLRANRVAADDLDVLYRLAQTSLARGRYAAARRYAERLVRLAPRQPEAQRTLGFCCLATVDVGRAKRAFLDVLQLLPGDAEAHAKVKFLDGSR